MIRAALLVVLPLALPGTTPAQTARFVHRPELPCRLDPARHTLDLVVVKFPEGSGVRLRGERWEATTDLDLGAVRTAIGDRVVERHFSRSEADLDRERAFILARLPAGEDVPAELNLYYQVRTRGQADSEELVDRLNTMPAIEVAYAPIDPKAYRLFGDIAPPTPNYAPRQGYHGAAPHGTEAYTAFRIAGGRGQGHKVAHIEGDWRTLHEDLDNLTTAPRVGTPVSAPGWIDHGTACASIMNAGYNGYGIVGYASAAGLVLSGIGSGFANAVNAAAAHLQPGDVASSSFGSYGPCGSNFWAIPPEGSGQADFDAVRNLTGKGVMYSFAAGNSAGPGPAANLDDPCWNGIWQLSVRDSGAFLCAASSSTARTRLSFSSYGSRIDANGWGENVVCADMGDLFGGNDTRQMYTAQFGGTSAAGPMVAGVCASYIGAVHEQNGVIPTPAQVRAALRTHGTPPTDGSRIGNLPDLKSMLAAVGLPDGLSLPTDPTLGGSLQAELKGPAGGAYVLFASRARGRTSVGLNRAFLLGGASLFVVETGGLAGGTVPRTFPVPNDASLLGGSLFLQSLDVSASSVLHLSSSAEALIVR